MLAATLVLTSAWTAPLLPRARVAAAPVMSEMTLTEKIMRSLPEEEQSLGAGGQTTYEALLRLDEAWTKLRTGDLPRPRKIVTEEPNAPVETPEYDLVVCGGNIGILLATALVLRGLPYRWGCDTDLGVLLQVPAYGSKRSRDALLCVQLLYPINLACHRVHRMT